MPPTQRFIERTRSKIEFAKIHLKELKNYQYLGRNDLWERAHEESCLFQLAGAVDSFLHEINSSYKLNLRPDQVKVGNLYKALVKFGKSSPELDDINLLRKDKESWLFLLEEMRNRGMHRENLSHVLYASVGKLSGQGKQTDFKDPRTGKPIPGSTIGFLESFLSSITDLINRYRQTLP